MKGFLFKFKGFIYIAVVFLPLVAIYIYAPSHLPQSMDPVQPDSWTYICEGLKNSNLNTVEQAKILEKISNWVEQSIEPSVCASPTPWFKGRLVLPFLISLITILPQPILIILPSILIYLYISLIWYQLVAKKNTMYSFLVLLLPFLSTHLGWHLSLVLTDGPMMAGILTLLLLNEKAIVKEKFTYIWILAFVLANIWTLGSRQSWPYVLLINFYILFNSQNPTKEKYAKRKFFFALIIPISSLLILKNLNPRYPGNTLFNSALNSFISIWSDLWSMFKYFDAPGLFILFLLAVYSISQFKLKKVSFDFIVFLLLFIACSLSVAAAYWSNPVYGQNWRLHLPAIFFGLYVSTKNTSALSILHIGEKFIKKATRITDF